jgi:Leucine-rich repeat (LRR) protein
MLVSYEGRHLHELHPANTRNFGVQAAALSAIQQLSLDHNCLRTLECPFAGPRGTEEALRGARSVSQLAPPPLPLRPETSVTRKLRSHSANTATTTATAAPAAAATSLEEEGSGLRSLTSLAKLSICHNELRTLRGLCGAAHTLTTLIATHNHLTSLDGIQACRHLTFIDLSYNSIESLRGLPLTCDAATDSKALAASFSVLSSQHTTSPAAAPNDPALALSLIEDGTDSSSVNFCCHTTPEEAYHVKEREAARRSASTNTSVLFHVDETESASMGTPAAFSIAEEVDATAAAVESRGQAKGQEEAEKGVQLILSHNRLRGRALAALLWVDSDRGPSASVRLTNSVDDGLGGLRDSKHNNNSSGVSGSGHGASLLLRPWSTALVSLDLSHNFIEDIHDVRRLLAYVPCPIETTNTTEASPSEKVCSTCATHAPVLPQLRHLDISGNPCLVNGSLAKDLTAARVKVPLGATPAAVPSVRRATVTPSEAAQASRPAAAAAAVAPSITFSIRYTTQALTEALRSCAIRLPSCTSTTPVSSFATVASAQPAMEALLRALAADWQDTPLRAHPTSPPLLASAASPSSSSSHLFALFSSAERHHMTEAAMAGVVARRQPPFPPQQQHSSSSEGHAAKRTVVFHGAEVTVLAAALQVHGARLGDALRVPTTGPPDAAGRPSSESRRSPRRAASSAAAVATRPQDTTTITTIDVFLTPPPKWGNETSTCATLLQTSLLSEGGGSPLPQVPQRDRAGPVTSYSSVLSSTAETRECKSDAASTAGYRLYPGRSGGTASLPPALMKDGEAARRADSTGGADEGERGKDGAAAVTPVKSTEAYRPSPALTVAPTPSAAPAPQASTDEAVAVQLYRAEIALLRRRFRELQRHTRDQTCMLQRHEAAMHEMKAQKAAAQQERDVAQAALAKAEREIQRLQAEVHALRGEHDE